MEVGDIVLAVLMQSSMTKRALSLSPIEDRSSAFCLEISINSERSPFARRIALL